MNSATLHMLHFAYITVKITVFIAVLFDKSFGIKTYMVVNFTKWTKAFFEPKHSIQQELDALSIPTLATSNQEYHYSPPSPRIEC